MTTATRASSARSTRTRASRSSSRATPTGIRRPVRSSSTTSWRPGTTTTASGRRASTTSSSRRCSTPMPSSCRSSAPTTPASSSSSSRLRGWKGPPSRTPPRSAAAGVTLALQILNGEEPAEQVTLDRAADLGKRQRGGHRPPRGGQRSGHRADLAAAVHPRGLDRLLQGPDRRLRGPGEHGPSTSEAADRGRRLGAGAPDPIPPIWKGRR